MDRRECNCDQALALKSRVAELEAARAGGRNPGVTMPVVYVSGRLLGTTAWAIAENVREIERWALRVAEAGAMPVSLHANSAHFHGAVTDGFWVDGGLALLAKSDAVVFTPSWTTSADARAEHAYCRRQNKRHFDSGHVLDGTFAEWVKEWST